MKIKDRHLIVRVTEDQFGMLVKRLDEEKKTRSIFLREMVEMYLSNRTEPNQANKPKTEINFGNDINNLKTRVKWE